MDAEEIRPLSQNAIRELLDQRQSEDIEPDEAGKRATPRWPFPGTVEVWLPGESGTEEHMIATLHDLSEGGFGMRSDLQLQVGDTFSVAIHQPEASFHGKATVRHCTLRGSSYRIGMQFTFEA